MFLDFLFLTVVCFVSSLLYVMVQVSSLSKDCMNASLTFTDILVSVKLLRSFFIFIKSNTSGCSISILIIRAPRLPFCPINLVVKLYNSINETAPLVCFAALFIAAPAGANLERSIPHPPP